MMKKTKQLIKFFSLFFFIVVIIWYVFFSLPSHLFNNPTSIVLVDKNDQLLSAHIAKDEQWRFPHSDTVNPKFATALTTYEDKRFHSHIGIDFIALSRAIRSNITSNKVVSGASTISMQVIRLSRNNPSRTYWEKLTEILRATRLELRYSKKEVMAFYASNAPFGGNIVGLDASAWKYFGRSQDQLSWAECTMLAVLPNSPGLIHPGRNRNTLLKKRNALLKRLHKLGHFDNTALALALLEELPHKPMALPNLTPHLLSKIVRQHTSHDSIYHTSLDRNLQHNTNSIVNQSAERLSSIAVYNASALVIEAKTGKVLAYTGNIYNRHHLHQNAVDMIPSERSTGSILKPLLYASMIAEGKLLPHQLVSDVPVDFHGYNPKNYNQNFDGVVPANQVVSRSLNVPSVNLLSQYGVERFMNDLKNFGMNTLHYDASHYGLSLILGGAEVSPWDLANMYTSCVQKLNKNEGQHISFYKNRKHLKSTHKIADRLSLWYMMDAMLDVKRPGIDGEWKTFTSSKKIAWKTGTSFGGRDAWAVGCTPDYVVVTWAGNTDGEGRPGLSGVNTSAPILFNIFDMLPTKSAWFHKPIMKGDVIKVCTKSGHRASSHCADTHYEDLPKKSCNGKTCPFCKTVFIDSTNTYQVSSKTHSPFDMVKTSFFTLNPVQAFYYRQKHLDYKPIPPFKNTESNDATIDFQLLYPTDDAKIYLPRLSKNERSSLTLKAIHHKKKEPLYWHLDGKFIGTTKTFHQLTTQPTAGKHKLTVVSDNGKRVTHRFLVVE